VHFRSLVSKHVSNVISTLYQQDAIILGLGSQWYDCNHGIVLVSRNSISEATFYCISIRLLVYKPISWAVMVHNFVSWK